MMILKTEGIQTPHEAIKTAQMQTLKEFGLFDKKKQAEYKSRQDVRQRVSSIMMEKVTGRTAPASKSISKPNIEGFRLLGDGLFRGLYPRRIKTPTQKKKYLFSLFKEKSINAEIYFELMAVLPE